MIHCWHIFELGRQPCSAPRARFPHWALTQHFHVQLTLKQWQSDRNYVIHLSFELKLIFNLHFCVHRNSNWHKQNYHYPVISLRTKWYFTYLSPWQQGVRQVVTTSGRQTSQSRLFWEWSFTNLLLLSARLSGFDTNLLLNKTLYRLPALILQSRLCCFLVWKRISVKCPPHPPATVSRRLMSASIFVRQESLNLEKSVFRCFWHMNMLLQLELYHPGWLQSQCTSAIIIKEWELQRAFVLHHSASF